MQFCANNMISINQSIKSQCNIFEHKFTQPILVNSSFKIWNKIECAN